MRRKNLLRLICLILCIAYSSLSFSATSEHKFTYKGQGIDTFNLENLLQETRYRHEEVDSTCTRQVPYQDTECGNETRYRRECRTIPGYQNCRNVPHRECRSVTRYRERCHNGPGRQVCHNEPGRQVCRNEPDRQECHIRNGRRICTRVPGGRVCRNEPGRRVCRTEPGRRICRQEPYTTQDCHNTTRRECNWVPSRESCSQVPYQEYVCRDVTRHRTETYACTRTVRIPYTVTLKTYKANIKFDFETNDAAIKTLFNIKLNDQGELKLEVKDQSRPNVFVIVSKDIEQNEANDIVNIDCVYNIQFINKDNYTSVVNRKFEQVNFTENKVEFIVGKVTMPLQTDFHFTMKRNGEVIMDQILGSDTISSMNNNSLISVNLQALELNKFWGDFEFTLKAVLQLPRNVINANGTELVKRQSFQKHVEPPYNVFHRSVEIANMKKLAKKGWFQDINAYKAKIRTKAIELFQSAGFNIDIKIGTITYNSETKSGSFEITLNEELTNQKIIEIFTNQEINSHIK